MIDKQAEKDQLNKLKEAVINTKKFQKAEE